MVALLDSRNLMSSILRVFKGLAWLSALLALPLFVSGQTAYSIQGGEYLLTDRLPGDQVKAHAALAPWGGFVVWEDNISDSNGQGISAQMLDTSFARIYATFRVNSITQYDQENPQVALLKQGGAVFAWQGGRPGYQKIYARFLSASNTFVGSDITVSTYGGNQIEPRVTVLNDNSVVITWTSFDQDGSMQGVYAQRFDAKGTKIGSEFRINQSTVYNQRTPAIAALTNGGFVITWISESLQGADTRGIEYYAIDVFARIYDAQAKALTSETKVNTNRLVNAKPAVAAAADGGFVIAWNAKKDRSGPDDPDASRGWDICSRAFHANGQPRGGEVFVNTYTLGDQYVPKMAVYGNDIFVVWSSMGQDGSWEGVFGRVLKSNGQPDGTEFAINQTTLSRQIQPAVAADGTGRFLVCWSAFTEGPTSFELVGLRFGSAPELVQPSAPFVTALSQSRLSVSWPELAGLPLAQYDLYIDGSATPVSLTNNLYTVTQLVPGSTHTFRLAYKLTDGRFSPMSDPATGKTWGEDENADGLPDDWQAIYWGNNPALWPPPSADSDGDGVSNQKEFLAGTLPMDASSVLRVDLVSSGPGWQLIWNAQPGLLYQVQVSTNINVWDNLGRPRLAVSSNDSMTVDGTQSVNYYRVIRMR
jgi:hypothetical protein